MKDKYNLEFEEDIPKYLQIANHIKNLIENKKIKDMEKLPTIREYCEFLDVNKITIINCYKKLVSDGFAYQKMGSGTYAKRKESVSSFKKVYSNSFKELTSKNNTKNVIDFAGETYGKIIFPMEDFKAIINAVLNRDGEEALIAQNPLGYEELRQTINNVFWKNKLKLDDILIVTGAQQGIDVASKAILNINDNVVVEKPTYGGALSVFKFRRANVFEVDIENDGIDLKKFEEILKKNRIKCFYTMSYFQNPTGVSYSIEKKKKIIELAKEYDFYIIEDDYLSELIYDKNIEYIPFKKLDKYDRVIYIKSFSKVFLPGIRLGYIVSPNKYKDIIRNTKFNTDIATSSLMQRALEMYIKDGKWIDNIENLKKIYNERYNLITNLIDKKLGDMVEYNKPGGGISLFLTLKKDIITSRKLFMKLKEKGVYITPGVLFFKDIKDGDMSFRIGFSQTEKKQIEEGINIIKEELECRI